MQEKAGDTIVKPIRLGLLLTYHRLNARSNKLHYALGAGASVPNLCLPNMNRGGANFEISKQLACILFQHPVAKVLSSRWDRKFVKNEFESGKLLEM